MNTGRPVFAQLMSLVHPEVFHRCVARFNGQEHLRSFSCWDQFLCMAFGQLTFRDSLRDTVDCLCGRSDRLYQMGFRGPVRRSILADANEHSRSPCNHHLASHKMRETTTRTCRREFLLISSAFRRATTTSVALIALRTDAPVLPGYLTPMHGGRYTIKFLTPIDVVRTGEMNRDLEVNTRLFNEVLEKIIREQPESWLWGHKRWKNQPPGYSPDIYSLSAQELEDFLKARQRSK